MFSCSKAPVILAAGILLAGCGGAERSAPAGIRPAKLIELRPVSDVRSIALPALIEASDSSDLTFQVGGLIAGIEVREGQQISQGEVIARLDQREFHNELVQAQAQFDQAQSEFDRVERLVRESVISQSLFDQRRMQLEIAGASLDSARKRVDNSVLRSPFDGVAVRIPARAHQNVTPQDPIVTVQSRGSVEAVVQVPATLVAYSEWIDWVDIQVVMDAAPERVIDAAFLSVVTRADPAAQTFEARFVFDPPEDLVVLPGMTGSVQVRLRVARNGGAAEGLTLPLDAIVSSGTEQHVWVVDPTTMRVSKRVVELGSGVGDQLPVISGLAAGELVVAAGAAYLHEGMQVRRFEP